MKYLIGLLLVLFLSSVSVAEDSFLYIECEKVTNGSYEWRIPAVEWNIFKSPFLFNMEFGEVYTAPRSNASSLNHGLIYINPNFGFMKNNLFGTLSIGARYYIAGNSMGIPEGIELFNVARLGIRF